MAYSINMVDEQGKTPKVEEPAIDWDGTYGQHMSVSSGFVSPEIEQAWMKEAERTLEAIRSGEMETFPHAEVLKDLKQKYHL